MADQGIWFKLWCASDDDPGLSILSIADYGRWCKLGTYTKRFGTDGVVVISRPPDGIIHTLQAKFQVSCFDEIIERVSCFTSCCVTDVSSETTPRVSFKIEWRNWRKYQGDFSTHRVREFRAKKRKSETPKKRREEKIYSEEFLTFWNSYPKRVGKGAAFVQWEVAKPPLAECLKTLSWQTESHEWKKDGGQFVPDPERWIKKRKWEDVKPKGAQGVGPNFF